MYACIEKAFEHSLLVYDEMFGSLGAIFKEELAFKLQNFWPAKGSSPNELSKFTLVARYQQKTRALSNYFRRQTATTHSVLQRITARNQGILLRCLDNYSSPVARASLFKIPTFL